MMRSIADALIQSSPGIICDAMDPDDADARRMQIESMVAWLNAADQATSESMLMKTRLTHREFGYWNEDLCKFTSYKIGFLVECLVLSFGLRSSAVLDATVKQAIRLLPPAWATSWSTLLNGDSTLPSATLSRARLFVDVGFMLLLQHKHAALLAAEDPPVFYGLADSSPHGGRNWELFEMFYIRGSDLETAAELARRMLGHGPETQEDLFEHEQLRSRIAAMILHHVFPNFSKGLLQCLELRLLLKDDFAHLLSFFHATHVRDLYTATLLPPHAPHVMSTGPPTFDGGRAWGVIEAALSWLLPRESTIRRSWSLEAFLRGGAGSLADAEEGGAQATRLQRVITAISMPSTHLWGDKEGQ